MIKKPLLAAGLTALITTIAVAAEAKTGADHQHDKAGGPKAEPAGKADQQAQADQQKAMQEMLAKLQAQQNALPKLSLEEAKEYFSRCVGIGLGSQLNADEMVDKKIFLENFNKALNGELGEDAIDRKKYQAAQQTLQEAELAKVKEEGASFLAENKTKEGVKVTASGLQYKVITAVEGGVSPKPTDTVSVHYVGTLIDGTEFDSSVSRGQPATFPLNGVIKGWTEGLQLMKKGEKFEFTIPSELAYGERGQGAIPPNSTLIFSVELLEIAQPKPATVAPVKPEATPNK